MDEMTCQRTRVKLKESGQVLARWTATGQPGVPGVGRRKRVLYDSAFAIPRPDFRATISRRGAGVVDRGGLENRCARKRTVGSNPTLSAKLSN